ncbi:MAG: MFS transporter [Chloroflexi bacterium]|nr:MFS transporter [Chloroflexota bacterium]
METYTPEVRAYLEKNARWNFTVNFLDLTFYSLALSFIFSSTVLSLYISHLTTIAVLIGLIPAIQNVGFYFPQLLLARVSESLPRKKPLILKISVMERIPYACIGLLLLFWPQAPNWLAYGVLAFSLGIATFAGGLAAPAWRAMLAKEIRRERRGILFGGSTAVGSLLGVGGAFVSRQVLSSYPYPTSFGICFMLCFVFQVCSYISLALNREPALESHIEPRSPKDYWARLPRLLKENSNFTRYLISRAVLILGGMGGAFYVIYARKQFGISDAFAANLTIVALVSQTIAAPILGRLADKVGHKWLTEICTLMNIAGVLLVLLAPSDLWFYGVFAITTAAGAGMGVAGANLTMEFSSTELPTYTALADTVLAGPVLLAPIIGGWLVDLAGYRLTFSIAIVLYLAGWIIIRWFVCDPRHLAEAQPAPENS